MCRPYFTALRVIDCPVQGVCHRACYILHTLAGGPALILWQQTLYICSRRLADTAREYLLFVSRWWEARPYGTLHNVHPLPSRAGLTRTRDPCGVFRRRLVPVQVRHHPPRVTFARGSYYVGLGHYYAFCEARDACPLGPLCQSAVHKVFFTVWPAGRAGGSAYPQGGGPPRALAYPDGYALGEAVALPSRASLCTCQGSVSRGGEAGSPPSP